MKPIPKELYNDVKSDKLNNISSVGTIVKSDEHNILYTTTNNLSQCVGFKSNHSKEIDKPFFLQHEDLFLKTIDLYKATFKNSNPELIAYFYSKKMDWACFLFADINYRTRAFDRNKPNNLSGSPNKSNNQNELVDGILDFGFFPVIGVTNDLDYNKNPAWYLLLSQSNKNDDNILKNHSNIFDTIDLDKVNIEDSEDKKEIFWDSLNQVDSYLCLEKSSFEGRKKVKYSDKYFKHLPYKDKFYEEVISLCSKNFENKLESFIDILKRYSTKNTNKESFSSIILDLMNYNLKITTNRSDKELNNKINSTYSDSKYFLGTYPNDLIWSDFITYLIRNLYIGFDNLKYEHVIDVLSEKNFFKTFIKRFDGFYKKPNEFKDYCEEQNQAIQKLKHAKLLG